MNSYGQHGTDEGERGRQQEKLVYLVLKGCEVHSVSTMPSKICM